MKKDKNDKKKEINCKNKDCIKMIIKNWPSDPVIFFQKQNGTKYKFVEYTECLLKRLI